MSRKKIAWITFNAFIDTDYYIVKELIRYYEIDWYILKSGNDTIEYIGELKTLEENQGIHIHMLQCGLRLRSLTCICFYKNLLDKINRLSPALIYSSMAGAPYFIPVLRWRIDPRRVILAIHNVHVPKGGSNYLFFKLYNDITIKGFLNFHTFSMDQYQLLKSIAPNKKISYAPFILKHYGIADRKRENSVLTFLNFGNIRAYKRIDVLIEAAQNAYEKTGKTFRVIIAGKCDCWDQYAPLIRYPELFDLRIHRIENNEIPNLFVEADYFVAPYQDIAQSGSSVVAINYGVPLIASRLPAFKEYITDKVTGYLIEPADVTSLENVIENILCSDNAGYADMTKNLRAAREKKFSTSTIVRRYREFIDEVIGEKNDS